jgi:hypothetical protein
LGSKPSQAPTPEPIAQQATPQPTVNDFLSDITGDAKASADTVINEAGEKEIKETISEFAAGPKMTKEEASTKVKHFIKMRDMLQSRGLAFASGKIESWPDFKMEQWEFDWFCEVYESVVMDIGEIPKWLEILLVEAFIMGPKIYKVIEVRKETLQLERAKLEIINQAKNTEAAPMATAQEAPQREDYQKRWLIDDKGFFTHTAKGAYLKQSLRNERPNLTALNYALLIKHNDQKFVDAVFGIK